MSDELIDLSALRARLEELRDAINNHTEAIHAAQEAQQQAEKSRYPVPVIISYDNQTVSDAKEENDRQYRTQTSIKNWTKVAVIAASIYAAIAALTYCAILEQYPQLEKSATAAKNAADTAAQTLISTNMSSAQTLIEMQKQSKAMEDAAKSTTSQARTSRDSLVTVQRAFVTFQLLQQARGPVGPSGQNVWQISVRFENSGTTPAVDLIDEFSLDRLPQEPSEDRFRGDNPSHYPVGVLGPKASVGLQPFRRTEFSILGTDLGDLTHGSPMTPDGKTLFVWAWVAYRDVFQSRHVTEFCSRLDAVEISMDHKNATLKMNGCGNYNCIDEYCPDYKSLESLIPTPHPN